jgi:hypothetical protein
MSKRYIDHRRQRQGTHRSSVSLSPFVPDVRAHTRSSATDPLYLVFLASFSAALMAASEVGASVAAAAAPPSKDGKGTQSKARVSAALTISVLT